MSIKAKQVAGVTTLVVVIVAILSAYHVATLVRRSLEETALRGEMLANAVFQRAREVVPPPGVDLRRALREDGGVRSILASTLAFETNVTYAAIVDVNGIAIAHGFQSQEGQRIPEQPELSTLLKAGPVQQLQTVTSSDQTYEVRQQLLAGDEEFGSIRIGVSMIFVKDELKIALRTAGGSILAALIISSLVAMLLAQWMLRPIHVIQSGLTRLGRGELDVSLDLPGEEFRDLGSSFEAVSAQLSAVREKPLPSASTDLESVMENLEDAVALFSPSGEVIFTNAAMKALLEEHGNNPTMRGLIDQTLAGRKSVGPVPIRTDSADANADAPPEHLLITHSIEDSTGRFIGAMLVARNLGYLSHVQSTLNYSRKLAALGRLMAGVAHEVKNPLNAMTIHLELLKQKLEAQEAVREGRTAAPVAAQGVDMHKHVNVISHEIRRLDEVMMGFLKFARPDELKLQPVSLADLISDVVTTVGPEAEKFNVTVKVECPPTLPEINADAGMLRQAILNLALNACQAMPEGGTLRVACRATARRRVEIDVEDTGMGIPPEHLSRIFDLYFTTKEKGTGIGLSMVYRIVQLHDGEVEVQSTPGSGTRFRLIFPQA
jgi:signal transduction histidine kinase